jgi:diaminopimelate epimerase
MRLNAAKLHGAENDFLFLDESALPSLKPSFLRQLAQSLCARNRGIGADGLVIMRKVSQTETELLIVNSDGSFAATCGNALRCLGLVLLRQRRWDGNSPYAVRRLSIAPEPNMPESFLSSREPFATLTSGLLANRDRDAQIGVLMGREKQPVISPSTVALGMVISDLFPSLADSVRDVFVELANPHWVFLAPGFADFSEGDFSQFGRLAQTAWRPLTLPEVPLANIGMIWSDTKTKGYHLVVFERGAGLTRCCGSGATAARVALEAFAEVSPGESQVAFTMPGGEVAIGREKEGGSQRLLVGPASFVAELVIDIDETPFV